MAGVEQHLSLSEAFNVYVLQVPTYHLIVELLLVLLIVKLLFTKNFNPSPKKKNALTKEEEEELLREWQPEPLVPASVSKEGPTESGPVVSGSAGPRIVVNGTEAINLATFNFHNLLEHPDVKDAAVNTVSKYGVGSCGPRGFYGTVDVHLELESALAAFTRREEAIVYSYGFTTIASVIPAYSKRKDIIFCDEGVNFAIQKGLEASRSKVHFFRHNDMNHLEELLSEQNKHDKKNPAKAKVTRKFIISEGLFSYYGDIAPLPKMVELRDKYNIPILLDESLSFGVLGETGHGATEHWGLHLSRVDIIMASLENALATQGGFCSGKAYVINHQRLSGSGYCFSASLPPLCAVAGAKALEIIEKSPEIIAKLRENTILLRSELKSVVGLLVIGDDVSPVVHLRLSTSSGTRAQDNQLLEQIVGMALEEGVCLGTAKYLEDEEKNPPPPSIQAVVNGSLSREDLLKATKVIKNAAEHYLQ